MTGQGGRELHRGNDPHDVHEPIDYFVWAIVVHPAPSWSIPGSMRRWRRSARAVIEKPIAEGLKAIGIAPDKIENVIVSHLHYDHAATTRPSRTRISTCRTPRWPTRPGAACATSTCAFRSRRRTSSRWCGKCSPAASASTTAWTRSPRHRGAQDRRALEGPAMRQREDQARHRGARLGHHAPLFPHRTGSRVSHHLQCGRGARGLRDDARSSRRRPTTSCRVTTRGC